MVSYNFNMDANHKTLSLVNLCVVLGAWLTSFFGMVSTEPSMNQYCITDKSINGYISKDYLEDLAESGMGFFSNNIAGAIGFLALTATTIGYAMRVYTNSLDDRDGELGEWKPGHKAHVVSLYTAVVFVTWSAGYRVTHECARINSTGSGIDTAVLVLVLVHFLLHVSMFTSPLTTFKRLSNRSQASGGGGRSILAGPIILLVFLVFVYYMFTTTLINNVHGKIDYCQTTGDDVVADPVGAPTCGRELSLPVLDERVNQTKTVGNPNPVTFARYSGDIGTHGIPLINCVDSVSKLDKAIGALAALNTQVPTPVKADAGDNCFLPDFNIGRLGTYQHPTKELDATLGLDLLMLPLAFVSYYAGGYARSKIAKGSTMAADAFILVWTFYSVVDTERLERGEWWYLGVLLIFVMIMKVFLTYLHFASDGAQVAVRAGGVRRNGLVDRASNVRSSLEMA